MENGITFQESKAKVYAWLAVVEPGLRLGAVMDKIFLGLTIEIFVDSRVGYANSLIDLILPSTIGFHGWVDRERGKAALRDDGLACFDFDGFKRTGRSLPAQP